MATSDVPSISAEQEPQHPRRRELAVVTEMAVYRSRSLRAAGAHMAAVEAGFQEQERAEQAFMEQQIAEGVEPVAKALLFPDRFAYERQQSAVVSDTRKTIEHLHATGEQGRVAA